MRVCYIFKHYPIGSKQQLKICLSFSILVSDLDDMLIRLRYASVLHIDWQQAQNLCILAIDKIEQIGFLNFLGFLRFFEFLRFFSDF